MAAKQEVTVLKLVIKSGQANPSPPVGPALGQKGVNIKQFCDKFNLETKDGNGAPVPVEIYVKSDRSFTFKVKTPESSYLIMQNAVTPIKKGSTAPGRDVVAKITKQKIAEIAEIKKKDLSLDISSIMKMVEGTARSMGVEVVEE